MSFRPPVNPKTCAPHGVIMSAPRRLLQYHGVKSTSRNVYDADLPLRFRVEDGKVLFNNRALLPFANFLGRLNVAKAPEDDREQFPRFAYYCSKNRNILLSKWSAVNSATQAFFRMTRDSDAAKFFSTWLRKEINTPVVGEGYVVDFAVAILEGEDGFDPAFPDLRKDAKMMHDEFHAHVPEPLKSELLEAAKTWRPIRDEYLAFFDEYEPVDVARLPRRCRPKNLTGIAYQTIAWMFK